MKKTIVLFLTLISINVFASPVNVNSADAQTISKSLKGIGLKKAEAIIQFRTKNGKFEKVDDLANVPGIGPKTIEANKADILLNDPGKK